MSELLRVWHDLGGVPGSWSLGSIAGGPEAVFNIPYSQLDTGLGSKFGSFAIKRVDNISATAGANIPLPILTAVTGSGFAQNINIPTTSFMSTTTGTYFIIEAGTANQEVVVASIVDSTHFIAICLNNHAVGALVQTIFSSFTFYLEPSHTAVVGGHPLSNIGFIRYAPLPANVYDQYILRGSTTTFEYALDNYIPWYSGSTFAPTAPLPSVPQYDSSSLSVTGNPTNAVVLAAGPIAFAAQYYANPQIQLLFTATPEPDTSTLDYRVWWDS
jgi:hypothetical protein